MRGIALSVIIMGLVALGCDEGTDDGVVLPDPSNPTSSDLDPSGPMATAPTETTDLEPETEPETEEDVQNVEKEYEKWDTEQTNEAVDEEK